jgi:tetratricopeptide (TPR) repeat protein
MTGSTLFSELRRVALFYGMLSRSSCWVVLLAATGVLVTGCRLEHPRSLTAQARDSIAAEPEKRQVTSGGSEEELTEAHAHYATGIIHELQDQPELALEEYYEAALKDPENETLVLEVSSRFLQANQSERALELLTRATARPGASGSLYARMGFIYSKLGKFDLAIRANRNAIKRQPRSLIGYQNLFLNYLQNKQDKEALGVLDEAANVPRTDADFLIGLAELHANFGLQVPAQKQPANTRALAILQRAEQMKIVDPQLRLKLADGFNLLGKDGQAAQIYMDLVDRLPDQPLWRENIRSKLADIYLRGHEPKRAAEQLEAVLRDNPTDIQAYYVLGSIAYDEKKYSEAEEYFNKVLLLDPNIERVYYELSDAQISANRNRQALETLERARQKFSENFLLEYLSGMAYSRQKDYTNAFNRFNAAEVFAQARDTNLLTREFYFQFGAACERKGDNAQAERYFEKCLQLSPKFAEALNYLGFMWADHGEKLDRARELIGDALKDNPQNAAYLDSMGWVLFKLGRPKEALGYLLEAIRYSEEEDVTLYDHLGDIYTALGQKDKAREAWGKALSIEPNEQVRKKMEPAGK